MPPKQGKIKKTALRVRVLSMEPGNSCFQRITIFVQRPKYDTRKWSKIQVPGKWELQGFENVSCITDTRYPFPANPPQCLPITIRIRSLHPSVTVPNGWEGMDIFLDFEGVESAYVWVNGELRIRRQPYLPSPLSTLRKL